MNSLEVKNLSKHYSDFSLENITFSLPEGKIMGLIGENGAGKSTTLKLILNLIFKDGGEIEIFGKDYLSYSGKEKEVLGVVLDEASFPDMLNVSNIKAILSSIYPSWDEAAFMQKVGEFKLPLNKPVKDFSKGMKMKLSLAVALCHNAKLLILDEATSGLDPVIRDELLDSFLDYVKNGKNSILISSHIISDLEKVCDYITFIHKGKLIFFEDKNDLIKKYAIIDIIEDDLIKLLPSEIIGKKRTSDGYEIMMETQNAAKTGFDYKNAKIEDIMLHYIKEDR